MKLAAKIAYWALAALVIYTVAVYGPGPLIEAPKCWMAGGSMREGVGVYRLGGLPALVCIQPKSDAEMRMSFRGR